MEYKKILSVIEISFLYLIYKNINSIIRNKT